MQKIKFVDRHHSTFFSTLRSRVDLYFTHHNISRHANAAMITKTVFFLFSFIALYTVIILQILPLFGQLILAILLGMTMAFIGFNICHDAIHGSYSSNKKVNNALSFIFNIIGANIYVWNISHNIVHHTYTNIAGHDEDIEVAPGLIRISKEDKKFKIQRFQQFYAFLLYSLASLSWFFRKDYVKFFQKKIGSHQAKHPSIEYFNLFFYKIIYYINFIVIPLIVLDIPWWQVLVGYLIMNLAMGLVLGLVFQLAHVVEETSFPLPADSGNIEEAWALHQMKTTANFSRKSALATFLCGGLNFQVEHHLFPKICHIHYKKLSDIVKSTAEEFEVPYIENKTFFSALKSHYFLLKKMGSA
jgi:linoleoyl-CoA desaturase